MYLQRFSDLSVNSFFSWNSVIYIFLFQSENIFIRKLSQTYWFVSRFDDFLPSDACEKLSAKSHNSVFHFQLHGGHIEAVVHVKEGHDDNMYPEFEDESVAEREDDSLDMLIDSKNNKYVLTRWKEKAFVASSRIPAVVATKQSWLMTNRFSPSFHVFLWQLECCWRVFGKSFKFKVTFDILRLSNQASYWGDCDCYVSCPRVAGSC